MKFMHNDNSKSLQAKSVLVKADRVAAGMNLVSRSPISPTRLSTRDWCETQVENCQKEAVETSRSNQATAGYDSTLTKSFAGNTTTSGLIQEPNWRPCSQGKLGVIPSPGNKTGHLNYSGGFGNGPLADHTIQHHQMNVINHDGSANLPVGKQRQQQRFLNGFQDEIYRSKQIRLRRSLSSNKKSLGMSL